MSVTRLFLLVLSLTAVSFGGGSIILGGLEKELVQTGILAPNDFAAAVALGQSTPGPLAAFTSAVGRALLGVPGAIAATAALVVVSLAIVILLSRVPNSWFQKAPVKNGLAAVMPFVGGLVLYLAYSIGRSGNHDRWAAPVAIVAAVTVGRLRKVPSVWLVLGSVILGMLVQGRSLAGW